MAEVIEGAFAGALRRGRDDLNELYDGARHRYPRLDRDAFEGFLRRAVAPVVEAVHAHDEAATDSVAHDLFDLALELAGAHLVGGGARYAEVEQGWKQLLPGVAPLVAAAPRRMASAVVNALHNLAAERGARPREWIETMETIGPTAPDVATWLRLGSIAAWRSGVAHYREGALELCDELPAPLACAALGVETAAPRAVKRMLTALREDPWLWPAAALERRKGKRELARVATVGGFRGFGGPFLRPPKVTVHDDVLIAFDPRAVWEVHADVFGTSFRRADPDARLARRPRTGLRSDMNGVVYFEKRRQSFPDLSGHSSQVSVGDTLALTYADSHFVVLLAPVEVDAT